MKKTLHILSCAAVAIVALASCAKEQFKENTIPTGEKIQVSVNGQIGDFIPADATKADAANVVRVTWAEDDKVYVYDGTDTSIGTLTVTPDPKNASQALLSGEITSTAYPAPTKLTLVYVKGATEAPAIAGGKISIDLSKQNGKDVPFVLYATIDYNAQKLEKSNEYVPFKFATSVMTVNCTGLQTGSENAVIGISKAEIEGVSTVCELAVTGSGVTVAGAKTGKITRTDTAEPSVFTQSDSRGSFKLALAADPAAPAARNILVHQGSTVSGAPFTTATLAAGKSYNTVYQMGEYVPTPPDYALPGGFTINANGDRVYFSKGNLWADATEPDNPVFYFEEHQYDYPEGGYNAENKSHVSYFLWSKYAKQSVQVGSNFVKDYLAYYYPSSDLSQFDDCYDSSHEKVRTFLNQIPDDVFFTNNPNFQVGTAPAGTCRTLTHEEWEYLFSYNEINEENPDGKNYDNDIRRGRYKYGVTVCGKTNCVVLLPDNWNTDIISLNNFATQSEYDGESNPTWEEMEEGGAVCLPATGSGCLGCETYSHNYCGVYWAATLMDDCPESSYVVFFTEEAPLYGINAEDSRRCENNFSIRLVADAVGYAPAVKVTGMSLNKTETTIAAGATETLAATVAPANATNKQITWSSSKPSVATVDENGEVTGVAEGSAVITATTVDGNFTAVCLVTVTEPYVIIGGLIWASKNLGATTVAGSYSTCYGDLYQCGSINTLYTGFPWTSATEGSFTFKEGIENGFYFCNAELPENYMSGEEGCSAELPAANDVVMQKVGNGWRMPKKEDFSALCKACGGNDDYVSYNTTIDPSGANATVGQGVYACTNYDGVAGCLFVDGNGNKLFFPAAGYGSDTSLYYAGSVGRYWSKTLNWSLKSMAGCFEFDTNEHVNVAIDYSRCDGYSIRPVKDIN